MPDVFGGHDEIPREFTDAYWAEYAFRKREVPFPARRGWQQILRYPDRSGTVWGEPGMSRSALSSS